MTSSTLGEAADVGRSKKLGGSPSPAHLRGSSPRPPPPGAALREDWELTVTSNHSFLAS